MIIGMEQGKTAMKPDTVPTLATYGTLRPGQANHDQLAGLCGDWIRGTVRGIRYDEGGGAAQGYPGLVLDPGAGWVEVELFRSADLTGHWDRLDAFEGEGYVRAVTEALTAEGPVEAFVYVLVSAPETGASA
jgi:gamma-glutamylcyclotransferase (GGCT)/AIG2-like uncharacterized protein YtfP